MSTKDQFKKHACKAVGVTHQKGDVWHVVVAMDAEDYADSKGSVVGSFYKEGAAEACAEVWRTALAAAMEQGAMIVTPGDPDPHRQCQILPACVIDVRRHYSRPKRKDCETALSHCQKEGPGGCIFRPGHNGPCDDERK